MTPALGERIREAAAIVLALSAALSGSPRLTGQDGGARGYRLRCELGDTEIADHWIYHDWLSARERAAREKKPIFAVFRCVP